MNKLSASRRVAIVISLFAAACSDFPSQPAATASLSEGTPWPRALEVGDVQNIALEIVDPNGRALSGVNVEWSTDADCCLRVSPLAVPAGSSVSRVTLLATAATSRADVIATVSGSGLATREYRVSIGIGRQWPTTLAVTQVDTIALRVDPSSGPVSVTWESSDTGILRVRPVGELGVELTALRTGSADLRAVVTGEQAEERFEVGVTIDPLAIAAIGNWPDTIRTTAVHSVAATVAGLDTATAASRLQWRSSNVAVFEVTSQNGLTAEITGRGLGSAELIAEVDLGFERSQVTQTVVVSQGWEMVSAGGWFAGQTGTGGNDLAIGHSCAVSTNEEVFCWGHTWFGQLGVGSIGLGTPPLPIPSRVPSLFKFQSVSAGGAHTCAVSNPPGTTDQGNVYCWGDNGRGELGDGGTTPAPFPTQVSVVGPVTEMAAGLEYTCVAETVTFLGSRYQETSCWGALTASPQFPGPQASELTAGVRLACITAGCVGWNWASQAGPDPAAVGVIAAIGTGFPSGFTKGAAGADHTCSVSPGGSVTCVGGNEYGQLGVPSAITCDLNTLVGLGGGSPQGNRHGRVNGLYPVATLYTNDFKPSFSPLALPCNSFATATPVAGPAFSSVTAGFGFTCALTPAGQAYCWGRGDTGQLGNGSAGNVPTPIPVAGNLRFSSLDAGLIHVCGVTLEKAIYCWGGNSTGQLGNGSIGGGLFPGGAASGSAVPVQILEPISGG